MKKLRLLSPLGITAALVLGGPVPPPGPGPVPFPEEAEVASSRDNPCWTYRVAERRFANRINAARGNHLQRSLRLDPELSRVARRQTREMVSRNLLHHTPTNLLRRRVTRWTILGENVGVGGSVGSLHAAFMSSPAHRANVLHGGFRHLGVGTRRTGGRLWVTLIFSATENPGTTLKMPAC